jgi:UDP-N-acetylglucosamine:LPS N-acetylglucosamine transferase
MLELMEAFERHETFFLTYDSVRTRKLENAYLLPIIGMNPWRMTMSVLRISQVFRRERPDVVVSTGSEIAIPAFLVSRLFGAKTLYIETWSRITSSSGTGRIVYFMADVFFVQWEQLLNCYGPKARYEGGVF